MSLDAEPTQRHGDPDAGPETSPNWLFARSLADDRHVYEGVFRKHFGDGSVARLFPTKEAMYAGGAEALLEGWLPAEPLIHEDTRVVAMGSCFAALFVQWLGERGFNRHFASDPESSFVWSFLETPLAVAQQFRWAFGEFNPDLAFWFGPDKQPYEATEKKRLALQSTMADAEVLIITLGLAETWYDSESGEAIWRIPPPEYIDSRYRFKVATVKESVAALETIDRLRQTHMPRAKVIYTTSPVRFAATFRPMSPVVANVASKAIVRASLDEFLSEHDDLVGRVYHYFPSYEMITELLLDPFSDNRHPRIHHSDAVIDLFARYYTTLGVSSDSRPFPAGAVDELRATNVRLESENRNLQEINEARLQIIQELKAACDERLRVIEELDAVVKGMHPAAPHDPL
jgi:hypothetical protein